MEKEGEGGEGGTLTVVQKAENFLNRDVWQIYGARRVLHFASWKPRRVHNSAIIYQTEPAASSASVASLYFQGLNILFGKPKYREL